MPAMLSIGHKWTDLTAMSLGGLHSCARRITIKLALRRPQATSCRMVIVIGLACAIGHATFAAAQVAGTIPEIHQPVVDDFGVERKSGRVLTPTTTQIQIGGSGIQNLSIAYMPLPPGLPGSQDYASMTRLDMRQAGHAFVYRSTGQDGAYGFEYYTIQYPQGSETFRRNMSLGSGFVAEYPNGGSLVTTANGVLFTDRNGITLETNADGANTTVLSYPDGRQIFYNKGTSDPIYKTSIANNFGYILKYQSAPDGLRTVGINQSVDICVLSSISCAAPSKVRYSVITNEGDNNNWTFIDAGGGNTVYRSVGLDAYTEKKYCTYTYTMVCNSPFLVTRYFPAGIKFPKDSAESVTISYANPDSQAEIGVSSIVKDGATINYSQQIQRYGSTGSSPNWNTLPYYLKIQSSSGAQQIAYSQANHDFNGWGGGRTVLNFVEDGLSRRTTYAFNSLHDVSGVALPEGNGQRFEYDSRWNVTDVYEAPKAGSGATELVTHYIYPASCSPASQAYCNKPTAIIDKRSARTDYTYNASGQVLTETRPADQFGIRGVTEYEYTLRTAYIKDAAGNAVAAGRPISLLTKMTKCRTLQICSGTSEAVVTSYEYGPSTGLTNLLLRGIAVTADGQTRRTCYSYNYFGERISETRPMANLSSCQ